MATSEPARFTLDETCLTALSASQVPGRFNWLHDMINEIHGQDQQIIWTVGCYELQVTDQIDLTFLLFDRDSPLDKDLRVSLAQTIDRFQYWEDLDHSFSKEPLNIQEQVSNSRGLAYAFDCAFNTSAVAYVTASSQFAGSQTVVGTDREEDVFFLVEQKDMPHFFRFAVNMEKMSEQGLKHYSSHAFPNIHFKQGIWGETRRFKQTWAELRPLLVHHLGVLNDHFQVTCDELKDPEKTQKAIKAKCGVDLSLESPQTHKKSKGRLMKEREIIIDKKSVTCEWHTKLTRTHDRIHFHPGNPDIAGGKLIVGIFHEHLPT